MLFAGIKRVGVKDFTTKKAQPGTNALAGP